MTGFSFEAVTYEPFSCEIETSTQAVRSNGGTHIFVTSWEQTIVDCLNHPDKSGGIEEVLNELQGLVGSGSVRLDKKSTKALGWSKRWKLCFPQTKEEVEQWIL